MERGEHALFLVGAGGDQGADEPDRRRLADALGRAARHFAAVDVVLADVALEHMLEALGYAPEAARARTAERLHSVRRRIAGALADIGPAAAARVRTGPLSAYLEEPGYREVRERARRALYTDMTLRAVRDRVAFAYLVGRLDPGALPAAAQVRAAFDHVDAGLPFLVDSPRILGIGSSVHCARSLPPFGRLLSVERRSGLRAAVRQGYAIVASPD